MRRCSLGGILLAFCCLSLCALGGPLEELQSLAQFSAVDLASLKQGHIAVERGPNGDFARGIYLESAYFIHAPIGVVGATLLHWDPLRHKELAVRLYHEYALPPDADAFKTLQLDPAVSNDNWLIDRTSRIARGSAPSSLHLTSGEAALLRGKSLAPSEAWQEILRRRSEALTRLGLRGVAPYGADASISPGSEFRGLLSLAPRAAKHFRPITTARPIVAGGKPASEVVGYWEATKVREHTTLQLGLFTAQKSPDSWQLLDCVYYPSDTYFMALDLFQLWSVDGGTLVWQVGFVSAPFRSYLGGIDRYVAGKQMTQETIDTIQAFRSDVEKAR